MAYGINWTSSFDVQPQSTDDIGNGHAEIVALKQGIRERVLRDHEFDMANAGTVANQGVHKKGSARAFHQANSPSEGEQANLASDIGNIYDGKLWAQANSRVAFVQTYGNGAVGGWQPLTIHPRVHEWSSYPAAPSSMQLAGVSYHKLTTTGGVTMAFDISANPPPLDGAVAIIDNKSLQQAEITIEAGGTNVVDAGTSAIFVYNSNVWTRITGLAAASISGYSVDPGTGANTIPVRANGTANAGMLPGNIEGNANGANWLIGLANTANVPAGSFAAAANPGVACANCVAVFGPAYFSGGKPALECDINGRSWEAAGLRAAGLTVRYNPSTVYDEANTVVLRDASGTTNGKFNGGIKIGSGSTFQRLGCNAHSGDPGSSRTVEFDDGLFHAWCESGSCNVYANNFLLRTLGDGHSITFSSSSTTRIRIEGRFTYQRL